MIQFSTSTQVDSSVESEVNQLMRNAVAVGASDVFVMAEANGVRIATRRHGVLRTETALTTERGRQFIRHIKAMAGMNISESRRPLDGRWVCELNDARVDVRVNTLATLFGEDMNLRIWDHSKELRHLDELGMHPGDIATLHGMLNNPSGLILVTGPTGTGKTTTLYASLEHLNDGRRKINTLEDPIEYALSGIRQSQVDDRLGLDFPELLRHVLRQAPDVIMIGEIRDAETANTAIRAANSGHLVLATLHAPRAASAVQSMLAYGVNSHFLSSSLIGIVAQRLVRRLCVECRVHYDIAESATTFDEIQELLDHDAQVQVCGPRGCEACWESGYGEQTGLFELMTLNQVLRQAVADGRNSREIENLAISGGMLDIRRSALLKVARGETSVDEILRDVPHEYLGIDG